MKSNKDMMLTRLCSFQSISLLNRLVCFMTNTKKYEKHSRQGNLQDAMAATGHHLTFN